MKNWLLALSGSACAPSSGAADVRRAREFGLEVGQLGAADAGAGRIAALGHEAGDHAVEHDAVVKAAVGELGDPLDVAGRKVGRSLMTTSPPVERVRVRRSASAMGKLRVEGSKRRDLGSAAVVAPEQPRP